VEALSRRFLASNSEFDVTDRLKDATEIKTFFKESDQCTNKANEKTNDNNLTNNIVNTTYQIEDHNHGPATATNPITIFEESIFIPDSFSAMDVQPCLFSQVQDDIDSNIVMDNDPNLFPDGGSNLFGTNETEPNIIEAHLDELSTIIKQLTDTSNFSPSSGDQNNANLHIIETEDAAATNPIPELHLTENIPPFDPVTFINDFEMNLGNKNVFPTKTYGCSNEGNNTMMSRDPMWCSNPGSGPISAPHLRLAGCGRSTEKAGGLKQRVRCG